GERHVEDLGQGLGQQRLAAAGRADQEDVRLVHVHLAAALVGEAEALVVVVDGDGEDLLGALLPDGVLVEALLDGPRGGDVGKGGTAAAAALVLLDDRLAQLDALTADVHVAGALDERADVAVVLAAERAGSVAVAAGVAGRPAPPPGARVFR